MAKQERMTTANCIIIRLDAKTMQATTEEQTVRVPYTRKPEKAAVSIRDILKLGAMDTVIVKEPLVQDEWERRVYSPVGLLQTALKTGRWCHISKDGTEKGTPENIEGLNRQTFDMYTYVMHVLLQREDDYVAAKVYATGVTECRAGIGSAQGYCEDVLRGKRDGKVNVYGIGEFPAGEFLFTRIAAWDNEGKMRYTQRIACYLTDEELATVPYTVYKRNTDSDKLETSKE